MDIDGTKHSFVIDRNTGLALPRNMAGLVANRQSTVNATIEAKPETKEKDPNIVKLDMENYGAPPENSGIAINPKNASKTEAQAWEDKYGNWFYNFPGALKLAQLLGRTLPDINQLTAAINANPDNFRQNAGYRRGFIDEFIELGHTSLFWSSSVHSSGNIYNQRLRRGESIADGLWSDQ